MARSVSAPLPPGSTIGILGGGQLGRMTALAAANFGYRVHIFCPEPGAPASLVSAATTVAAYDDGAALDAFADAVDVVTFEFENVPSATVERLAARVLVRPGARALHVAQDRLREKTFLAELGIATAPFRSVDGVSALTRAVAEIGPPAILKTSRFGYDGKGQIRIEAGIDPAEIWRRLGADLGILEGYVDFAREISVIVARGAGGETASYVPVENRHVNHILDTTVAPAPTAKPLAHRAQAMAGRIAEALELVGLLAVEMFETRAGEILVNEIAPRPHNSGHWTMDACHVSQFEQFVRAVAGLPLGSPERHSDAVMKNLIGEEVNDWSRLVAEPGARLHLYGKTEARPGRKMGHVTRLKPRTT
ncbi:MAG: 5-(carboxyamino)imidazole ribonucleotide synthase [Candidatus Eiseniibacteriota bacterium]